jgi:hypothetical protein
MLRPSAKSAKLGGKWLQPPHCARYVGKTYKKSHLLSQSLGGSKEGAGLGSCLKELAEANEIPVPAELLNEDSCVSGLSVVPHVGSWIMGRSEQRRLRTCFSNMLPPQLRSAMAPKTFQGFHGF